MSAGAPRLPAALLATPGLSAVLAALAPRRALIVGGAVRNALLGEPVDDIDIATDARPEEVIDRARAAGLKPVPTGLAHGTITVVSDGVPFEVTSFRRDVETDGRRAVVAFSDRIEDDAARRDFTMNALYAEADGRVLDPVGGLPDLAARRLRFVGDADRRIAEDYLRILRFFRFHARYGRPGGADPAALAACARGAAGIATLSRERVGAEMRKLLAAPDPAPAVALMEAAGVLARVLPDAEPAVLAALGRDAVGLCPTPQDIWIRKMIETAPGGWGLVRLAALAGGHWREAAAALRLSKDETRGLEMLETGGSLEAAAWRSGVGRAAQMALLRQARGGYVLPPDLPARLERAAAARFPLRSGDLMPALAGPALGAGLAAAEAAWVESGFALDRAALVDVALAAGRG